MSHKTISDSLYGYIDLSESEYGIISHPRMQRLRRVNQLGLTSLVYPGASHTRFEHSLGVTELAGQLSKSIGLDEDEVEKYRLAGLLHDVGHYPFSHSTEVVFNELLGTSHEERSCEFVRELESDGLLAHSSDEICDMILGRDAYNIVNGSIDCDRMDYLQRDSEETGIPHGNIDSDTIIKLAKIHDGELVFDKKSIRGIESLFYARMQMMHSVYGHHTSLIAERMLNEALSQYIEDSDTSVSKLAHYDDYQLHSELYSCGGIAENLYSRVADRRLYKRAAFLGEKVISRDALTAFSEMYPLSQVAPIEREIAEEANVEEQHVLIDSPIISKNPIQDVNILMGNAGGTSVRVGKLSENPALTTALQEMSWRVSTLGVYTPAKYREAVRLAAAPILEDYLGEEIKDESEGKST